MKYSRYQCLSTVIYAMTLSLPNSPKKLLLKTDYSKTNLQRPIACRRQRKKNIILYTYYLYLQHKHLHSFYRQISLSGRSCKNENNSYSGFINDKTENLHCKGLNRPKKTYCFICAILCMQGGWRGSYPQFQKMTMHEWP